MHRLFSQTWWIEFFSSYLYKFVIVFIDDMLMYSKIEANKAKHLTNSIGDLVKEQTLWEGQ